MDIYVATPNGSLQKYDHKKNEITTIATDIPSDPNDPTRLNNIGPVPDPQGNNPANKPNVLPSLPAEAKIKII